MIARVGPFNLNLNLWLAPALAASLLLGPGCASKKPSPDKDKKYSKHDQASIRLYLEVNRDGSDSNEPVSIGRQQPFILNVEKRAFLTEFNVEKASVVESMGGFSISLRFDKEGSWILEQYTTGNKGKHMAIAAEFGQMRWLAAPLISARIGDGLLVFTPDATREEAERIVSGVNRVAELVRQGRK
jgi:preprotein translocase subunit SecD